MEYLEDLVKDALESDRITGLNGICDILLINYVYESEREKNQVRRKMFAEVCRRRPRPEILPFHHSPREVVAS